MKRCLMSLFIGEMQIKAPIKYQLTFVRMAIIHKSIRCKCWQRRGEKETLTCVGGLQIAAATMENSMKAAQKIQNNTTL